MADQGFPPYPPQDPATLPPAPPPYPQPMTPPAPRKSAWPWVIGVLILLVLLVGSCMIPFALFVSSGTTSLSTSSTGAVAVIKLDGAIAGTGGSYVTPDQMLTQIEKAEKDSRVKAILLRVDSPGGTVAASEEIAAYIREAKKPVVVSAGDIDASGAYMVSSQADEIWANPGTSVGSIGVIAEIPNVKSLTDKVGVEFQVIKSSKFKDTGSPYRPLTKEEKALIHGDIMEAYAQFIDLVAKGRNMDPAKVRSLATGWVWSGDKAKQLGLIDHVGTYRDALRSAAKLGGIKGDFDTVSYEDDFGKLLQSLSSLKSQIGSFDAVFGGNTMRGTVPR